MIADASSTVTMRYSSLLSSATRIEVGDDGVARAMALSRKPSEWLVDLKANEDLSVVRGLGSLAFVRAQGRTLEERSQEKVLALL
jgi:hypothetical protein